ncbi:MAG: hypothetical protein ACW968_16745 [Candidatus Thorarchaeota archaeon]
MNDTRDLQALKQKIMSDIYKNRMLLTSFRDRPEESILSPVTSA